MKLLSKNYLSCDPLVFISLVLIWCNYCISDCESLAWNNNGWLNEEAEFIDFSNITPLPNKAYQPKVKTIFIKSKIRFRYARTRIISNVVNPDPKQSREVNLKLRLPKEAFISRFEMKMHGSPEIIKANITRREDAEKILQFARSENRSVTLGVVEQSDERFNEFSMKLLIGAQKTVMFMLIYEERLPRVRGMYEHVIHLEPQQLSDKTIIRIEVMIQETEKIISVSVPTSDEIGRSFRHATVENLTAKSTKVVWTNKLENGETYCDYPQDDFVVAYQLEDEASTGHVLVRNGYFVHFFAPEMSLPLKKHVVLVLDISDSMFGTKITQLKSAMMEILDEFNIDDFFNIIVFSSKSEVWSHYHGNRSQLLFPFPANEKFKDSARHFVNNKLNPRGSTNLHSAIITALEICRNVSSSNNYSTSPARLQMYKPPSKIQQYIPNTLPKDVQSIILLFTDGTPTSGNVNKKMILYDVQKLNRELSVPIFSLAFGDSADLPFLTKLSQTNFGFVRKVFERADATLQLADFYREISSPTLTNLTFSYSTSRSEIVNSHDITNSGNAMTFKGTEILVVGKLNQGSLSNKNETVIKARVNGNGRYGRVSYDIPVKQCGSDGGAMFDKTCPDELEMDDKCLEKLYVYMTIKNLLQEQSLYDQGQRLCWPSNPEDIYWHESIDFNEQVDNCTLEFKDQIITLALQYGLVTPYTSIVMRTKSILEEEMDTNADPRVVNEEWEWFLGNVNPLPDSSKFIDTRNQDVDTNEDNTVRLEELPPIAQPLTTHPSNLTDNRDPDPYRIIHLGENMTQLVLKQTNSSIKQDYSLNLSNVTWLKEVDFMDDIIAAVYIPNLKGQPIPYSVAVNLSQEHSRNHSGIDIKTCNVSEELRCAHLAHCLLPEFINDFQIYINFYWCPIRYKDHLYLGVCCPYG